MNKIKAGQPQNPIQRLNKEKWEYATKPFVLRTWEEPKDGVIDMAKKKIVFQSDNKIEVEEYIKKNNIDMFEHRFCMEID